MEGALTEKDIPRTVEELRRTFKSGATKTAEWRRQQLNAFMRMLKEGRSEIADALHSDLRKNPTDAYVTEISQMMFEVQHMLDDLDEWMAPTKCTTDMMNLPGWSYQYKDPLGVALIIGSWNYPWYITMLPVVGAIAAGNTVLIKVPSQHYTPATSQCILRLVGRYLDNSAIRVAYGDREMTQAVIQERYDMIFYTGGGYVGQMVAQAAAKHLTPTILELGGKNPCIIDKHADIKVAARRTAWGAVGLNNGQTCVRPDYVLVHEDIAEQFLVTLQAAVKDFFGDDPRQSDSYTRVVNQRAAVRLTNLIKKDQRYVRFGGRSEVAEKYIEPTCLDFKSDWDAFKASEAMSDEIFGPVIPVIRWKNLDEIIDYINSGEKSLALYVFTTDDDTAERILTETSSGGAVVNDCITHLANANLPFGGVGKSGMGSYHGKRSFESFSHIKSVIKKTNWFDAPQRYPPYKKDLLMELALTPIPARMISAAKGAILIAALAALTRIKRRITIRPDLLATVAALVWLLRKFMLQPPKQRLPGPRKA